MSKPEKPLPPRPRSNDLMTFLAETSGYCCVFAFMKDNAWKQTGRWARELGVSVRLVRAHRALLRDGITRCRRLGKSCSKDWVGVR